MAYTPTWIDRLYVLSGERLPDGPVCWIKELPSPPFAELPASQPFAELRVKLGDGPRAQSALFELWREFHALHGDAIPRGDREKAHKQLRKAIRATLEAVENPALGVTAVTAEKYGGLDKLRQLAAMLDDAPAAPRVDFVKTEFENRAAVILRAHALDRHLKAVLAACAPVLGFKPLNNIDNVRRRLHDVKKAQGDPKPTPKAAGAVGNARTDDIGIMLDSMTESRLRRGSGTLPRKKSPKK